MNSDFRKGIVQQKLFGRIFIPPMGRNRRGRKRGAVLAPAADAKRQVCSLVHRSQFDMLRPRRDEGMRWFLSYHTPDQGLAERLKAAIERKDATSNVFFAPSSLRAGGAWTAQLAEELAFILLLGEAGVGKWQVPEYDEALDRWVKSGRTFPIIVVLLNGQTAPGLPFLRQLHWIVTPDPASEKDIARIFDGASGGGARPPELWRYASPYRGLEAMEETAIISSAGLGKPPRRSRRSPRRAGCRC